MKNNKIIKICKQKFIFLNYSDNTVKMYTNYIKKFIETLKDKQVVHCNSKDFQNYIDNYNFTSVSQQNQIINAIRFLYKYGLNRKYNKVVFQRPRKERKLPQPISKDYLIEKIDNIKNLKHKSILSLAYSTGLRVSEVTDLKIKDIDSKRMVINVKGGKGNKDRVVPLSENILKLFRKYFIEYKPKEYLFNGQTNLKYSTTSCNKIMKKYIGKDYHFHQLRHSSATTLLENGVDLRVIQKILGHSNVKTTEIYTHVSTLQLSKISLPI